MFPSVVLLGASSMTYTMVIRAETTSLLTFDNNAAASEKAACRGGGGAAAGVATRPGEPRVEPRVGRGIQVNQELGAHTSSALLAASDSR